ncbi:MAG: alpha-amylase family glycosyl hydrolase [Spirochaetes bacterium]|nr:alpha-amylase family glycosyl hydrolase [Spirochaetota bacterium]
MLDLVANHSSDEHPWFVEARSSRQSPRHDWYLWVPDSRKPPNNWKAVFELGSAWHRNPATGELYLGTFTSHQPEFDWNNPEVREAFLDIMRYWYDLGVDGFRLDVATAYAKDLLLRSNPFSFKANPDFFQKHLYDRNQNAFHNIFRQMRRVADQSPASSGEGSAPGERVLIGEPYGWEPELAASCYGKEGDELHMAFNFDFLNQPWNAEAFRRSAERWYAILPQGAWPDFCLSNHDQPRHVWRYRARDPEVTVARAKTAAAMLLTLRGSPFLYYGEELGMSCVSIPRKDLRDPLGLKTWPLRFLGRDPERTPMQWDDSPGAGFTENRPWLPINPDWKERNVEVQRAKSDSLLSWYRDLLALRREEAALRHGGIRFLEAGKDILAYERSVEASGRRVAVFLNFASRGVKLKNAEEFRVMLGSARSSGSIMNAGESILGPCEVVIACRAV